jgi:hypothetical protein
MMAAPPSEAPPTRESKFSGFEDGLEETPPPAARVTKKDLLATDGGGFSNAMSKVRLAVR